MDKRAGNKGTKGNKGGRPSKADEQKLIEKLTPLEEDAFKALKKGLTKNQNWAVKLFFEYKYGKAKEFKEIDINSDAFNIIIGE